MAASRRFPAPPAETRADACHGDLVPVEAGRRSQRTSWIPACRRCREEYRPPVLIKVMGCHLLRCGLQAMERGVTTTGVDQIVMGAIFYDAASIDGDNPVGAPDG